MFLDPTLIPGLSAAAAAAAQGAPFADLFSPRRSRASVARARQLAVYLHHVALGASVSACAKAFARDRATIRHACATIEDLRDDPLFDAGARRLETALAAQRDMICALLSQGSAR
ncbi:MAG: Chromosomal replication initiator DnaA domain [Methylocystaceae bacterium]|nr:MAG: Chromosomal replication initiator DnaA [Methylocystaceae bacterium]TXT44211.1 MAG: Chromosomal replication initiator DnaA domain [Methylocystaceae bacterium]